jgi:hypothetical protein
MDWEPTVKLPTKWLSLLEKLWVSDENSIGDFLPEIVALIKSTKSRSVAATGLFTVMHSPKVRDCFRNFKLLTPSVVVPDYLVNKLYADAARLPIGEVRKKAIANAKQAAKEEALTNSKGEAITRARTMEDMVAFFDIDRFEKETDEASAKRAMRARKLLGMQRKSGRPQTGQK